MTVRYPVRAAALALLAGIVAGGAAVAQTTAPDTAPAAASDTAPPRTRAQTPQGRQIASRVEKHIAELHKRLRITAAQQAQWDAFAQIMRDNAAHSDQLFKQRADSESMNAVEDLRSYAAIAQAHAEDVQRLVPAFQALYESMSPDQQKAADTAFKEFEQRGRRAGGPS